MSASTLGTFLKRLEDGVCGLDVETGTNADLALLSTRIKEITDLIRREPNVDVKSEANSRLRSLRSSFESKKASIETRLASQTKDERRRKNLSLLYNDAPQQATRESEHTALARINARFDDLLEAGRTAITQLNEQRVRLQAGNEGLMGGMLGLESSSKWITKIRRLGRRERWMFWGGIVFFAVLIIWMLWFK